MRVGWPEIPSLENMELRHILDNLQRFMPYDRAILFGHYAKGNMYSVLHGFELLLITSQKPEKDGGQLENILKRSYRYHIEAARNIHIETAWIDDVNHAGTKNRFYTCIRDEGIIVYDNGQIAPIFKSKVFRKIYWEKNTRHKYSYYFNTGSALLEKAEQAYNEGLPQIAAIHFAYAAIFLLRAAEIVFYGNHIQTNDILRIFKRCRHFSRELQRMFPLWNYAPVFLKLSNLRDAPLSDCNFDLKYRPIANSLRQLQQLIQQVCERHFSSVETKKVEPDNVPTGNISTTVDA